MSGVTVYTLFEGEQSGPIIRTGVCAIQDLHLQAKSGQTVLPIFSRDAVNKVVDRKIVVKTIAEIEASRPPVNNIPDEEKPIMVRKKEWDSLLKRVQDLEP